MAVRKPMRQSTQPVEMNREERDLFYKQRRSRSIALALGLAAVVVIFYVVSLVQGPGILQRPM